MTDRVFDPEFMSLVIERLRSIYDPEMPVNIYDLGLIYDIDVRFHEDGEHYDVVITMTLTSPACPVAESLPEEVKQKLSKLEKVKNVDVHVTFDPPWDISKLSDEVKLDLGLL